jgi:hypothetical protein
MKNTLKGIYNPENPAKYIGKGNIVYRSSWELLVCKTCDKHPAILSWASEPITIPYYNPFSGKQTVYVPDFLVIYEDVKGKRHSEIWEIKPKTQTFAESAKRKNDKIALQVNLLKWQAAGKYCDKHGLTFRVINEDDLFKA